MSALTERFYIMVTRRRHGIHTFVVSMLCFLFVFVSILPVTYLLSYTPGIRGLFVNVLKFVPPAEILLLFAALVWAGRWEGLKSILCSPLFSSVAIFQVIVFLSSLGAVEPLLGLSHDFYYAITGPLVALIVVGSIRETAHRRCLVEVLFWTAVVVSAYGVLEFALGRNPLFGEVFSAQNPLYAQFATEGAFGARIKSSAGHPVFMGAYLLMVIPLGLAMASESQRSRTYRILTIGGVLCAIAALLLTFSRGAWGGFGIGMVVYAGLRVRAERMRGAEKTAKNKSVRQFVWMMVFVSLFAALLLSFDKVSTTLTGRGTLQQVRAFKTDPRGVAYAQVAGIVADHPLLGVGTAHYRHLAKRYGDYDDTPDNGYLRALAENGILGLGAMIAVFAGLLKALVRQAVKKGGEGAEEVEFSSHLAAALTAGFAGFFVDMITCDALQFPLTRMTFWMLAGVAMRIAHGAWRMAHGA